MSKLEPLLQQINTYKKDYKLLTAAETLQLIRELKRISESKNTLEKIILLLVSTDENLIKTEKLTKRESKIFSLIGSQFTSQEIADILNVSKETISTHRKNIIKKLNLKGTRQLQNVAFKKTQEIITKNHKN